MRLLGPRLKEMHIIHLMHWVVLQLEMAKTGTMRVQRLLQTTLTCSPDFAFATKQQDALLEGRGAGVLDPPPGWGAQGRGGSLHRSSGGRRSTHISPSRHHWRFHLHFVTRR